MLCAEQGGAALVLSSDSDSDSDSDAWMHDTPRRKHARKQIRLADAVSPLQQASSGSPAPSLSAHTALAAALNTAGVKPAGGAGGLPAKPSHQSSSKPGHNLHKVKHSKHTKHKAKHGKPAHKGAAAAPLAAAAAAAALGSSASPAAQPQGPRSEHAVNPNPAQKPRKPHDSASSKPPRSPKSPAFVSKHGAGGSKPGALLRSPLGQPAWSPGFGGGKAKAGSGGSGGGGISGRPSCGGLGKVCIGHYIGCTNVMACRDIHTLFSSQIVFIVNF